MKNSSLLYRVLLILGLTLFAGIYIVPSVVTDLPQFWKDYLPVQRVHLGLDLQGGTHLVLTVDVAKAIENTLDRDVDDLKRELADAKIAVDGVERKGPAIQVRISNGDARTQFTDLVKERFPNFAVESSGTEGGVATIQMAMTKREEQRVRELALDQSLETIRNRIDQFGVTEPIIQRQGTQDILIQLPGIQDPQRAKDLIGRTAVLEFKILAEVPDADEIIAGKKPLPPGTEILKGTEAERVAGRTQRQQYLVQSKVLMTGDTVADALVRPATQMEGPYVALELNARGAKLFDTLTGANVGKRLAIVLDSNVYSAPVIRERISGGHASITGSFDMKEARDLAIVLRAGALPAPVHVAEERTVGPSLGKDSIRQGMTSFIVGGSLVVLFMLVYYKFAGVLADMALILNIVYLIGALAALQATLTLPGIAGIVLTLGMAVDANVLINERIREELRLGKSPRAAIDAGYERALPAILDSNITTFLSGIILFQFGSGPIKGFAVTLCIGIVSSVFTAVVGTRVVYDYLLSARRLQTVSIDAMELIKPGTTIDFVSGVKYAVGFSWMLIAIGIVSLILHKGPNYGIDFVGGTMVQVRFNQKPQMGDIRAALTPLKLEDASIQDFGSSATGAADFLIRLPLAATEMEDISNKITAALSEKFGKDTFEIQRVEMVGPRVGKELRVRALLSVVFATIMMGAYIWFRFEFRFGLGAAIALMHDVLITIGALSIFNYELDLTIVAALLTVVGFSVNDTVIVSDRIRENMRKGRRESLTKIINNSINETLSRTILTTGTAVLVLLALFFLGGNVINGFAFALLVGFTIGTYSSIYVASPIVLLFERAGTTRRGR